MHKHIKVLLLPALLFAIGCDEQQPGAATAPPQSAGAAPLAPIDSATRPQIARGRLNFVEGYRAGIKSATTQKKPMLLFFTAEWCHYCHELAAEAFTDERVVNLSQQFVCVLVDADQEADVCRYFQVRSYPTIQFVSTRGQILNRVVGKRHGQELVRQMHAALQAVAQTQSDERTMR